MRAIRVLWIDGQTKNGYGTAPAKLALHKDTDGMFRWFGQGYNACGIPAGPCTIATGVSASTVDKAIEAARDAWGSSRWNLRTTRTMREHKSIIEAARAHIAGCVGEAEPRDAYNCFNVGDLPTIRGVDAESVRQRLHDEIRRQLAAM